MARDGVLVQGQRCSAHLGPGMGCSCRARNWGAQLGSDMEFHLG